jgi:hypothetical protein
MLTRLELDYIRRAFAELSSGNMNEFDEAKILRTMSQITGRAADRFEDELNQRLNEKLEAAYQDMLNQRLLEFIKNGPT